MADGGLTVLDGTQLRSVDFFSLQETDGTITGDRVLELAESIASSSLFRLTLPESLKSSALSRLNVDDVSFRRTDFGADQASVKIKDLISAIADELQDDPLVVVVLDGQTLRVFLADEDDFAMLAENLFTDLDTEDKGKISKKEIRNALAHMGVEMGIPPFTEFPMLDDILKKHGAEGEEELGQAQFAQVLQLILQELAESLAEKNVIVIQNIKIINGSKLKKLLANEKQLNDIVEKILKESHDGKDGERSIELIRSFLEKNGWELGLPPPVADDAVILLYDAIFADVAKGKSDAGSKKDDFIVLLKEILEKFAQQLEASPVFHDLHN